MYVEYSGTAKGTKVKLSENVEVGVELIQKKRFSPGLSKLRICRILGTAKAVKLKFPGNVEEINPNSLYRKYLRKS